MTIGELHTYLAKLSKEEEKYRVYNYHRAPKQSEFHRGKVEAYNYVWHLLDELKDVEELEKENEELEEQNDQLKEEARGEDN